MFCIIDPLNGLSGKRSLLIAINKRVWLPLIVLALGALLAGFSWETLNYFVPKWTYPIEPWFWRLPGFITAKYIAMPWIGMLGYIPFCFGAFALVEFLELRVGWFGE